MHNIRELTYQRARKVCFPYPETSNFSMLENPRGGGGGGKVKEISTRLDVGSGSRKKSDQFSHESGRSVKDGSMSPHPIHIYITI
jgi:hypothetical protein